MAFLCISDDDSDNIGDLFVFRLTSREHCRRPPAKGVSFGRPSVRGSSRTRRRNSMLLSVDRSSRRRRRRGRPTGVSDGDKPRPGTVGRNIRGARVLSAKYD